MIIKSIGLTQKTNHDIGDTVYLVTDSDQSPRIITAITVRKTAFFYELSCGTEVSDHEDFEISSDKTFK
jgi:hypothetical protein